MNSILFALSLAVLGDVNESSVTIKPCQSWRYNSQLSAYVCTNYNFGMQVVEKNEYYDALRRIEDLEIKIGNLEDRIEKLENGGF